MVPDVATEANIEAVTHAFVAEEKYSSVYTLPAKGAHPVVLKFQVSVNPVQFTVL